MEVRRGDDGLSAIGTTEGSRSAALRGLRRIPRARMPAVLPGFVVIVAGLVLSIFEGGFPLTAWYPAALFLLVLLVLLLVAAPPSRNERSRLVEVALGIFGLFCIWALLSIVWADTPGLAWDAGNRVLLYTVVLGLVCLRPWSAGAATWALGTVGFGTAAIAVVVLVEAATAGEPSRFFVEGRLLEPTGYLNANANLWLIGFFPALHLAASRLASWPVRGVGFAAATLLMEMALLSQSRGAAIAFALTAVIYLAFTTRRWPALLALVGAAGLTALAFGPLVDVRESASVAALGPALDDAATAIAASCGGALVLGCVAALAGSRMRPWFAARPQVRRRGDLVLLGGALCAAVALVAAIGDPASFADDRWRDFKESGYEDVESGRTRFSGSLGSGRYDFYRVALAQFRDHPLLGVGGDNFAADYLQRRRTAEAPQHPHSLVFMVLSQYGAVGAALLAAFLALMFAAVWRVRRRGSIDEGAAVAGALAAAVVWLTHSTGDWLWEFPALGTLGLSMLGVAARLRPGAGERRPELRRVASSGLSSAGSAGVRALFAVIVLAAATSLALPGISARYANAAYKDGGRDRDATISRLERAADLNPLSAEPLIALGVIAQRLGEADLAVEAFRRGVDRAPENWFAHLELGLATALTGDVRGAEPSLREARRLNPRQPITREILASIRRGDPVDPQFVEQRLNAELERRFSPTDPGNADDGDSGGR